jgi:PD-(D/E)XK nuclease superfamily
VKALSADDSIALGAEALARFYGDFEAPADSAKSLERMIGAFEYYFANYPLERGLNEPITYGDGKRGIEFSFASLLPILHPVTAEPIVFTGRMDAILGFAGGAYVTDEKTTTSLGPTWGRKWDLRSQFTGYAWGCRQYGIDVQGTLVRGIAILKTKFDTAQAIVYHPSWAIDRWLSDTCDWIESAVAMWRKGHFRHALDSACADFGGCPFRDACLSQDKRPWLETAFERRRWNPLVHQEVPLGFDAGLDAAQRISGRVRG